MTDRILKMEPVQSSDEYFAFVSGNDQRPILTIQAPDGALLQITADSGVFDVKCDKASPDFRTFATILAEALQRLFPSPSDEIERLREAAFSAIARAETAEAALTLSALREANVRRQAIWCPVDVPDMMFRGVELAGEVGEALNVLKKLERERLGWRGTRSTASDLASEIADMVICADLLAMTVGIDLAAAVVAKFNATSEKVGIPVFLPPNPEAGQ